MGDQILQFIKDNLAEICNETQYYLNLRSDVFVVLSEFQHESELDELIRQIQTRCKMFKNIKLTYSIGVYIVNDRKMLGLPEDAVIFFYTADGNNNKWSAGKQFTQRIAYSTDLLKWEQADGVRYAAYINKMAYAAQTYSNTGNLCMTVQ